MSVIARFTSVAIVQAVVVSAPVGAYRRSLSASAARSFTVWRNSAACPPHLSPRLSFTRAGYCIR